MSLLKLVSPGALQPPPPTPYINALSLEEAASSLLHCDWSVTPYRLKSFVCAKVVTVTPASPPGLPKHRKA